MTKNELNKFKNILEAKQAELVAFVRNREGIAIEKSPDALDEVQHAAERELAIRNLDRESQPAPQRAGGAAAHRRRHLRRVPALRRGHQSEAAGGGAVDCRFASVPGNGRSQPGRRCVGEFRRNAGQRGLTTLTNEVILPAFSFSRR